MNPLEALLRERIAREGSLSFREVMAAALYHPRYGYYTRLRGFGAEGDFMTSPERHPAFGWLLGRQALDVWEALGRPSPFKILELGAGSGALAEPLVAFLRAHGEIELVYTIDEASPSLLEVQQRRLTDRLFRWDHTDEPAHFILANEVADALPVHRVVVRNGRLFELNVGIDNLSQALSWVLGPEARAELQAYFEGLHYLPAEGAVADVCLDLVGWVAGLSARLERGLALVMDYTASPPRDSVLTYFHHTVASDPFVRLGQQDISVPVDMRTLVRLAIGGGLRVGATAQRGLLLNLGFDQVLARLTGSTDRQALAQLVETAGLGGQIAAVFLIRDLPGYVPAGARADRVWPAPEGVPSLPPDQAEADFLSQWREAFPAP